MCRLRMFSVALTAVLLVACGFASAAFAEEEKGVPRFLPEAFPIKFEASMKKTVTFETKVSTGTYKMLCKEVSGPGEITSKRRGLLTWKFTSCGQGVVANECKTGAEPAGTVVIHAEFDLVTVIENMQLTGGILVSIPETIVECPGGFKDVYRGKVIGRIPVAEVNKEVESFQVFYEETGSTQALRECGLPKEICEPLGIKLKFSLEGKIPSDLVFNPTGLEMLEYRFQNFGKKITVEV
jgi:hypothetical protein